MLDLLLHTCMWIRTFRSSSFFNRLDYAARRARRLERARVDGGGKMNAHQKLSEDEKEKTSRHYPFVTSCECVGQLAGVHLLLNGCGF
jgi:hypothetical protein